MPKQGRKSPPFKLDSRGLSFIWRFCFLSIAVMILYYAASLNGFFQPAMNSWAVLVGSFLKVYGFPVAVLEQRVVLPGVFGIDISLECTGVPHLLLFLSAVFAYPALPRIRLSGALLVIISVFTVNLLRLIALFITGVQAPQFFDIAHVYIWGGVSYIGMTVIWLFWLRYANAKSPIKAIAREDILSYKALR